MIQLISTLLTIGIAYWYFKTAEKLHSKPLHWAFGGAIAYQLPAWLWKLYVTVPYSASLRKTQAQLSSTSFLINHSWILVGIIGAVLVYYLFLIRTTVHEE